VRGDASRCVRAVQCNAYGNSSGVKTTYRPTIQSLVGAGNQTDGGKAAATNFQSESKPPAYRLGREGWKLDAALQVCNSAELSWNERSSTDIQATYADRSMQRPPIDDA